MAKDRDIEVIIKARDLLSSVLDDTQKKVSETGDTAEKMGKRTGAAAEFGRLGLFSLGNQAQDLARSMGIPMQASRQLGNSFERLAATAGSFALGIGGALLVVTSAVAIFNALTESAKRKREALDRSVSSLQGEVTALYSNREATDDLKEATYRLLVAKRDLYKFELIKQIQERTKAIQEEERALDRLTAIEEISRDAVLEHAGASDRSAQALKEVRVQGEEGTTERLRRLNVMREENNVAQAQLKSLTDITRAEYEGITAKKLSLAVQTAQNAELQYAAENYGLLDLVATPALSRIAGMEEVLARAAQFRSNVSNAANRAMEVQLLKLVETHRFSVSEFGKAVAQSVKIELIGIAARAAVWAIFETAMGLATMFTNPAASAAHFASAGQFALVAGATVAAAAAVNAISGPGAQLPGAGEPGGTPIQTATAPGQEGGAQYYVQLTVVNPLSDENWDEAIEQHLIPALDRAGARNVQISSNVVRTS